MTDQANEPAAVNNEPVAAPTDSLITDEKPLDFTTKPEGFPDDFWDAEKNTPAVNKLYEDWTRQTKIAKDLRVKLSRGEFTGQAPKDIKEYALELADDLKAIVPDDDKLLNAARVAAKEAGLPKDVFNKFMTPVITEIAKLKAEADMPLSDEEKAAQEAEIAQARQAEISKLGPNGNRVVAAIDSFRKTLEANGTLTSEESEAMKGMVYNAESARVMNKLRAMAGNNDVPIEIPVDDKASRSEVEKKMAAAFAAKDEAEYTKYAAMLAKFN